MSGEIAKLKAPKEVVECFSGVALDLGGSTIKILYRSKEDYSKGRPINTQKSEYGILRGTVFPSEQLEKALEYIQGNVDLTEGVENRVEVPATGLGGNNHKLLIEKKLHASVANPVEFMCFNAALIWMLRNLPPEDCFIAHSARAMEMGIDKIQDYQAFMSMDGMGGKIMTDLSPGDLQGKSQQVEKFPLLLVICGSAFILVQVEADGSQKFLDVTSLAGRYFLGSSAVMTGVKDHGQLMKMLNESDGKSIDMYTQDVTTKQSDDSYSSLSLKNMLLFNFGKGNTKPRGTIKDGDLIHSSAMLLIVNLAQLIHLTSIANKLRRVIICGSFVNDCLIQDKLLSELYQRNARDSKDQRMKVDILKNGGFLGALGAAMMS